MLGNATHGRKRMELLHDMMGERDYGQLKDLISDRSRWRQESKWECVSETCWKQQRTKEERTQVIVQRILQENKTTVNTWKTTFSYTEHWNYRPTTRPNPSLTFATLCELMPMVTLRHKIPPAWKLLTVWLLDYTVYSTTSAICQENT